MLKQVISKNFGMKVVNRLRQMKWFVLAPFVNDRWEISKFYASEIDLQIVELLIPHLPLSECSVVLDIGANIGAYSYFICDFIHDWGATCIGFEPRTDTYNRLVKNVTAENFIPERAALSNREGYAELVLHTSHGLSSLVRQPEFQGFKTEKVQLKILDAYIELHNLKSIAFIKVDVEGHELEVLEGGRISILKSRPVILCESENSHLAIQGRSVEDVFDYMHGIGYKVAFVSKGTQELLPVENVPGMFSGVSGRQERVYNYWFLPDDKYEGIICDILKDMKTKASKK